MEKKEISLVELVEGLSGKIGQGFFDEMAKKLARWLDVDCVIISQISEDRKMTDVIAMFLDGEISNNCSFQFEGSPCESVAQKGYCKYPKNITKLFPADKDLVNMKAKGYVGTPLFSESSSRPTGILCFISRKELSLPSNAEEIIKIIGARIAAEIDRKKIEEDLIKANASKDRFFSIIGHDLRNSIGSIMSFSELMMDTVLEKEKKDTKEDIKQIFSASEKAYRLLEDLLQWALSQTNEIKFQPKEFCLCTIKKGAAALVAPFAKNKNITIISDECNGLKAFADKDMLETVLRNLLSNAIKFTEEGGEVKIGVFEEETDIRISVSDTGRGISLENQKKLFKVEEKQSTLGTNKEYGTGLGLILCKEFIEKHDGKIWVESEEDKGSVFSFTIKKARRSLN